MKKFIHQLFAILMVLVMLFDAAPVAVLAEGEDTQLGAEVSASAESGNATGEANPVSRGGQLGVEKANYYLLDASEYTVTSVTGSFDRFLDPNYVPGNASQAEDTRGLSEGEDSAASTDDQQTQALAPSAVITPKLSKRSTPVLQTKDALGSVQTLNTKGVEAEPANDLSLTSVSDGESSAAPESPSATVEEPKASDTNAPAVPEPQQVKGLVAYEIELNEGVPFAKEYDYKVKVPVGVNMLKDVKEEPGKIIKINQVNYRLFHLHGETEEEITNVSVTQNDGIISNFTFTTEDFSTFVLVYTVDFEYVDEQGETHTWSFPGTGSYAIADIMSEIGVEGTITDVQLARTIDVGGAENALYLSDDHTELVSDVAFQDTFELTVKVQQTVEEETVEKEYTITVTDSDAHVITMSIASGVTITDSDNVYAVIRQKIGNSWYYYIAGKVTSSSTTFIVNTLKQCYGTTIQYSTQGSTQIVLVNFSDTVTNGTLNNEYYFGDDNLNGPTDYSRSYLGNPVSIQTSGDATTITITKRVEYRHTAHVQLEAGVSTDDLYVIFVQDKENDSTKYAYSYKPVTGSNDYVSDADFTQCEGNNATQPYDPNKTTTVVLMKTLNNAGNPQDYMFSQASFGASTSNNTIYTNNTNYPDSNGKTVTIAPVSGSNTETNITIGNTGPITYTASIAFTEDGEPVNGSADLGSGDHYILAKVGENYYSAQVTSASGALAFKDSGNNDVTDLTNAVNFKFATAAGYDATSWGAAEITANWNGYTVPAPTGATADVYAFSAAKTTPTYTATISGNDFNNNDVAGYYLLAKNGDTYRYYAPLGNLSALKDASNTDATGMKNVDSFEIVKFSGEATMAALSAASVAKLGNDCTVGKSGGFYTVAFPNAPDGSNVYQFTATKQADATVTLTFNDKDNTEVSGGVTPNGIYYLVAKLNNQYAFYARVNGTDKNLTFYDDTHTSTNLPATVGDNYVFVKTSSEVNSLAALSSANEVVYLETTDGKRYELQDTNSPARVAQAKVVDYTATISGFVNAASDVNGYYLLAKEGSTYKYFAPLGDLTSYTDGSGNSSNVMQDVNGFDIVKYTGSETPTLSALSAESKKLGDNCTVGQPGAYYWINFPTTADSNNNYAFTAVKQLEGSVSLAFKDTSDTEVTEAVALDGTYYIVASLNGERAFYAHVTGTNETLNFLDAGGNGVTENKLPQGVNQAYEIVKVSEGTTVSSLADLASGEVVSTMATTGTKEYYLDATGAPALAAREADINAPMGDTHTTTVRFFDSNVVWSSGDGSGNGTDIINTSATDQIVPDPALEKYYYVLATIEKTTEEYNVGAGQNETHTQVYWAVKPINLRDLSATSASVTFNAFHTMEVNAGRLTSVDGIHFLDATDPTVTTRLIHSDIPLDVSDLSCVIQDSKYMLSTAVEGANLSDQPETGYRFATGWSENNLSDEIHLYRTDNNNRYKIRLRFSPGSAQAIQGAGNGNDQTSKYYYVMAEIRHANSGTSYAYANVEIPNPSALDVDDDGYYYKDYEFDKWRKYDGTERSDSFTGHEQGIEVRFVRSIKKDGDFKPEDLVDSDTWVLKANAGQIYNETDEMGSYTIHYDTRESRHSNAYYKEDGDGNTVWCYDVINLTSKSASSDYDYTTILGPNLIYGIVAEHLYQPNHLQTNFAVNHFSGHGHDIRPDLSGNSAGNIVIAEFNESDGSCRNSVGAVAYDPVWGRAKIGKPLKGTLFAYVDDDSGDPTGSVYDNPDQTVVVPTNGADLSANIVEPGIEYGKRMSAELLTKPATLSATIVGGKAIIDTTGFDEYDTIYVDGDLLVDYIGTTGGLEIHKKDNQTIVFNFDNRSTSRNITINKFIVKQPSFAQYGYPDGYGTESPEATGSDQNKVMDEIARHIVWNLAECTRKVTIDTAGGIFLQPNDDSEIEIKGTTAGWIVSDGYVYNGTAEWHNVFEEMPESVSVTLTALKTVDGKVPKLADKFNFKLEKLDFTHYQSTGKVNTYSWRQLDVKSNNLAQVQFDTIQQGSANLQVGWNIFRISEIGPHADNTGHFITDTSVYYAAVLVREIVEQLATTDVIHYYVDQPRYYTSFDVTQFQPFKANQDAFNPVLTGMGAERVAIPTFRNETVTTGLTLMKRVEGTDLTNKKFTFQVKLWTENEQHVKSALMNPITVNGRTVALTTGYEGGDSWSTFEISLKNGQKVTIAGLTEGVHYEFTETKVGNKEINNENADADGYIDGYKPLTFTDDGQGNISYTVSDEIKDATAATAETFVNEYKSKGEIGLNVTKTLQDKQLLANMFSFTLTGGQAPIVGYNDADGNVTFSALPDGKLHFNQSDMAGATKNEDGYLVKEITYVLREGKGTATEAEVNTAWNITDFSYENVVYDSEKVITLVLTDRGDGTITVHPKNTHDLVCEVNFNNKYKEKGHAHFEGSKVMEGRPITKAEFAFDAVLTSIDGTLLPTDAQITAAAIDAARAELLQQRAEMLAKVSSAHVFGTNEAKSEPDAGTDDTYTADITFPEIYFSAAGTYVYTITENTGSMPADAQQKENTTTSYTATITVAEQDGKLVAGTPVYDPTPMTFTNQTKTISFNVTKVWLDSNGISASDSKFITFSVMYNGTMLTAADLTGKLNTSEEGVELDGNNVKLTSDANGVWPIARFSGVPAGRYVIQEESHSATTNGSLHTTYAVLAEGAASTEARSTNIVRDDGDTLTITNKETRDIYTNITIQKKWKAGETEYVPTEGTATFELRAKKNIGGEPDTSSQKIKVKVANDEIGEGNIGDYIEVHATGIIPNFSDIGTDSGPRFGVSYYTQNYSGDRVPVSNVYPVSPTAADSGKYDPNQSVDVLFRIPIENVSFVSGSTSTATTSMVIELSGLNNGIIDSKEIKSGRSSEDILINTVTLSNDNHWTWTKSQAPVSLNDGEITYKYYIKEVDVPNEFTVTYNPAGSEGQSGFITTAGSATLTATNTQETVNKKVFKAWSEAPAAGTTIQLSLYAGTTEAAAAASTLPVRTITLDGTEEENSDAYHNQEAPAWTANFYDLPKYDAAGNVLYYIVKETLGDNDYIVIYGNSDTATYVVASDADTTEDVATINNTKADGALKLTKLVTVNGHVAANLTEGGYVDGGYVFSIVGPTHVIEQDQITKYVLAEVRASNNGNAPFGEAFKYYISDYNYGDNVSEWYNNRGNNDSSLKTYEKDGNSVVVDGLEPGDYVITEQTPANGATLVNAVSGDHTGATPTGAVPVTVHVTAGKTVEADLLPDAQATFTNNYETVTISAHKIWKDGTESGDPNDELPNDGGADMEFELQSKVGDGAWTKVTQYAENPKTIHGSDAWTATWDNLPKRQGTSEIQYRVLENKLCYHGVNYYVIWDADGTYTVRKNDKDTDEVCDSWIITHTVDPETGVITYTNTLKGALSITKAVTVNGAAWSDNAHVSPADGTYTFTVSDSTSTVVKYVQITVTNGQADSYKLSDTDTSGAWDAITAEPSGTAVVSGLVPGTYTVAEVTPTDNGTTLTGVTVNNVAVAAGTTVATLNVAPGGIASANVAGFTNNKLYITYNPKVTKSLEGRDWKSDDSFTFTLAQSTTQDGVTMPESDGLTATVTNSTENKTASFGAITFTKAGTFTFTVTETVPNDASNGTVTWAQADNNQKAAGGFVKNGITYDGNAKTLTVTVSQVGNALTITKINDSDVANANQAAIEAVSTTITNTYAATGSTTLKAKKDFTSGTLEAGKFSFVIEQVSAASENAVVINAANASAFSTKALTLPAQPVQIDASGEAVLAALSFTKEDAGTQEAPKEYYFRVKENVPADADATTHIKDHIQYDVTEQFVTVSVYDNGDGTLTVTKTPDNSPAADFVGTWTNVQLGSVEVTKTFVFPQDSNLAVPSDFQITARWTIPAAGESEEGTPITTYLKTGETIYTLPSETTLPAGVVIGRTGDGTTTPYAWTINNLPIRTEVTFTESGYEIAGYNVATAVSPESGKATAAVTPGTVAITNTYTPGVELPATGGSGTLVYTVTGLTLLLGASFWLLLRRRREQN